MRKVLIILFTGVFLPLMAQDVNLWQVLAEVGYTPVKAADGSPMDKPVFSKRLKSWNKKTIRLKGYLVPLSEINGSQAYMLSSLPFSMCYFCGGAGPETVVELQTTEKIRFVTRQLQVEGELLLNETDPDHHMYILRHAHILD